MSCTHCAPGQDADFESGCACDHEAFPPCLSIAPGQPHLKRQTMGFPEYREHLLSSTARRTALSGWVARQHDDLGVMLLESWAYVLDIVQFYDSLIANESYLRTATQDGSLRKLVAMTGYRPRPAVAASVELAVHADTPHPVVLPAGTAIRSKGMDGIAPQVFETSAETTLYPRRNSWQLAPVRSDVFEDLFAFAPRAPGVLAGQVVAFTISGVPVDAARVETLDSQTLEDGEEYRVATFDTDISISEGTRLDDIALFVMAQNAGPSFYPASGETDLQSGTSTTWLLDGIYPQIDAGDLVVVDTGSALHSAKISSVQLGTIELSEGSTSVPGRVTKITLDRTVSLKRVFFRAREAGRLINPGSPLVATDDLVNNLAAKRPVKPFDGDTPHPDCFIATGDGDRGAKLNGTLEHKTRGGADFAISAIVESTASELAAPIRYHGNIVSATRGETVRDEVLGGGRPSQAFQTFRLKKKPLTYLSHPGGIVPELEVRVNGIVWRRIDTFLEAKPGEEVYIIRHTEDGETDVIFGEDVRPPSGNGNITASYRYGAGADVPPAGTLKQPVGKLPIVSRFVAPLLASGGSDVESPGSMRTNAPAKMMTAGHAVSLADYRAAVASYPGVVNSDVQWRLAEGRQQATIAAVVISAGGDLSSELQAHLRTIGDPLLPISVDSASAQHHSLNIDLDIDARYSPDIVIEAVRGRLEGPDTGLLIPDNITIGGALFGSVLAQAIAGVEGVADIRSILVDGADMPVALAAADNAYLSFDITVGGSN